MSTFVKRVQRPFLAITIPTAASRHAHHRAPFLPYQPGACCASCIPLYLLLCAIFWRIPPPPFLADGSTSRSSQPTVSIFLHSSWIAAGQSYFIRVMTEAGELAGHYAVAEKRGNARSTPRRARCLRSPKFGLALSLSSSHHIQLATMSATIPQQFTGYAAMDEVRCTRSRRNSRSLSRCRHLAPVVGS